MPIKKDKVRIWITIHQDTKKTIELLMPLLKANSMGNVVERAITAYGLAVIELAAKQVDKKKEGKKDEEVN